jgi:hypothetical protein
MTILDLKMVDRGKRGLVAAYAMMSVLSASAQSSDETEQRKRVAAANMQDAIVVDCQLPGKLRRLGGTKTYLTPGRLIRTSAIECRTRGGEYTVGDLGSGTLSLQRWMRPASDGDAEAQYYVARIHANGMDNVPVDYAEAARWYQMAADQGYAEAKQELGYLNELGLGVDKDELLALNLQREASGLGEELDFAYKIADAQALAAELEQKLLAANQQLQSAQIQISGLDADLSNARASALQQEVRISSLIADLNQARRNSSDPDPTVVQQLEAELEQVKQELGSSQATLLRLEQEQASRQLALSAQLQVGQAAKLELRELRARTEDSEQKVDSLSAELVESQQRLLSSEEEIRRLQASYREQLDKLTAERQQLLEARSNSNSEAAAFVAAQEARLVASEQRVRALEDTLASVKSQLEAATSGSDEASMLRVQLEQLQARYDADIALLRSERDSLAQSQSATQEELDELVAQSKQELAEQETLLEARGREIETLNAETARLRNRVESLQAEQLSAARAADLDAARLTTQLMMSGQQSVALRNALQEARNEKAALESRLVGRELELQRQLNKASADNAQQVALLKAEIDAAKSTINTQAIRIASLESEIEQRDEQVVDLMEQAEMPVEIPVEYENAKLTLELARSSEGPKLGRYHALLIANEKYINMPPLSTPIRDAFEIEKLLITRYGFSVEVMTDATDDQVMRKLHEYANKLTPEDNLLIYYAGRGSTPDGPPDRAYWLGVDADPALRNTWLLAEHVSEKIKEMKAKRILLVTDSCFSQRRVHAVTTTIGRGLDPDRFEQLAKFRSRFVLTSGANVPVYDEGGDNTHSLFAKTFMEILRQNSNVLSGEMLSFELAQRVSERVEEPQKAMPSYSSLQGAGHVAGDFFFVPAQEPSLVANTQAAVDRMN